jgi:hypothetical protein
MRSLIIQGKDKLTKSGLIKKKRSASTSGNKDSGARLALGKAKREGFNA